MLSQVRVRSHDSNSLDELRDDFVFQLQGLRQGVPGGEINFVISADCRVGQSETRSQSGINVHCLCLNLDDVFVALGVVSTNATGDQLVDLDTLKIDVIEQITSVADRG